MRTLKGPVVRGAAFGACRPPVSLLAAPTYTRAMGPFSAPAGRSPDNPPARAPTCANGASPVREGRTSRALSGRCWCTGTPGSSGAVPGAEGGGRAGEGGGSGEWIGGRMTAFEGAVRRNGAAQLSSTLV